MIKNLVTKDFYIGSSLDIYHRFSQHKNLLKNNKHFSIYLQRAWNKYGENEFEFILLESLECELQVLRELEQAYLDTYSPRYNMSKVVEYFGLRERNPIHQQNLTKAIRESKIKNSSEYRNQISKKIGKLWSNKEYRDNQITSITSEDALNKRNKSRLNNLVSGKRKNNSKGIRSVDDILEIRKLYGTGKYSQYKLGEMFSVSHRTIGRVVSGESWKAIE